MGNEFESRKEDLNKLNELINTVDPDNAFYKESLNEIKDLLVKMDQPKKTLEEEKEAKDKEKKKAI